MSGTGTAAILYETITKIWTGLLYLYPNFGIESVSFVDFWDNVLPP